MASEIFLSRFHGQVIYGFWITLMLGVEGISVMLVNAAYNADMNLTKSFSLKSFQLFSPVYFIKRSRIRKAAVPDLVHHLNSLNIVPTIGSPGN